MVRLYNANTLGAQTNILQNLQYYEHLSQPMAELVNSIIVELNYPNILDLILVYAYLCFTLVRLVIRNLLFKTQ